MAFRNYCFFILLLFALLIPGISYTRPADSDVRVTIEAANQKFMDALAAKDSAAIASMYSSEARLLPPNEPPVEGRDNIKNFWQGLIDGGLTAKLVTDEVHDMGDVAAEVGTFNIVRTDGKEIDKGKYIVLWIKENGKWKLHRDMWSSNSLPAAPPQTQ